MEPTKLKPSAILYITSGMCLFWSMLLIGLDVLIRSAETKADTLIESFEWNSSSQFGLFGIGIGLFLFCLGIMADKQGA